MTDGKAEQLCLRAPSNPTDTTRKHEKAPAHTCHPNKSARSGVGPSTPSNASEEDVREVAKVRQHETASIRVHRFLQARNDERCISGRASRERARRLRIHKSHGLLTPQETSRTSDQLVIFQLFVTAWVNPAPSTRAALVASAPLQALRALRRVTSTASWAPWFSGKPDAKTSTFRSSRADTMMLMSLNITLVRTTAPASRQIRAKVLSGATSLTWGKLPCGGPAGRDTPHTRSGTL